MMIGKKENGILWSQIDEDDEGPAELDFLLPPKEVIGPDDNGIKKVIEYKFDHHGNKVKITTDIRVRTLSRDSFERRFWAKFGDAFHDEAGSKLTVVSTEEILLQKPNYRTGQQHDSSEASFAVQPGSAEGTSTYIPPSMRVAAERMIGSSKIRRRNEENSVRVTNLSEDTREADLDELFSHFGQVTRVHVAIDRTTGMSRGFGFVNFVFKEDAERAIDILNGYGYDNLILRVEWATPRAT